MVHNSKVELNYYKNEQKIHMKLLDDVELAIQQELGVNFELSDKLVDEHFNCSYSIFTCYQDIKEHCKFIKYFTDYIREHVMMEGE